MSKIIIGMLPAARANLHPKAYVAATEKAFEEAAAAAHGYVATPKTNE